MTLDPYPHQNTEPSTTNQLPSALTTPEASQKDSVLIPTYDPNNQFSVSDLEHVFPEWREQTSYDDPQLAAISYARTQALRENSQNAGQGNLMVSMGGEGLLWGIQHTPFEVGKNFDAHGLANKYDPVQALDHLLKDGVDPNRPLYSMNFIDASGAAGAFGADRPLTSGGLIVLSDAANSLREHGIKYVVAGEEYMEALDLMRSRYPDVTFVPWNEAPKFLTQQANEAGLTTIPLESLNTSEPAYYPEKVEVGLLPTSRTIAGSVAVAEQVEHPAAEQVPDTRTAEEVWEDSVW